jgi:hypothetical protein
MNRDITAAATEAPVSGAGSAQAPWRAGRAPAGGVRAVGDQGSDAWAGESKRWPAVARSDALRRRQKHQGSRAGGVEAPGGRRGMN